MERGAREEGGGAPVRRLGGPGGPALPGAEMKTLGVGWRWFMAG
jgi:hypothetical protein